MAVRHSTRNPCDFDQARLRRLIRRLITLEVNQVLKNINGTLIITTKVITGEIDSRMIASIGMKSTSMAVSITVPVRKARTLRRSLKRLARSPTVRRSKKRIGRRNRCPTI